MNFFLYFSEFFGLFWFFEFINIKFVRRLIGLRLDAVIFLIMNWFLIFKKKSAICFVFISYEMNLCDKLIVLEFVIAFASSNWNEREREKKKYVRFVFDFQLNYAKRWPLEGKPFLSQQPIVKIVIIYCSW